MNHLETVILDEVTSQIKDYDTCLDMVDPSDQQEIYYAIGRLEQLYKIIKLGCVCLDRLKELSDLIDKYKALIEED